MARTELDGSEWATHSGDVWARRWRETSRGLSDLAWQLDAQIVRSAPEGHFRALDVGCGAGETSEALARARPDSSIIGCDLSPALAQLARERLGDIGNVQILTGDAETVAGAEGPFDLIFSRHGVMFFDDPVRAFRNLRSAARVGAALVFSCFDDWSANPWAADLASAAAGKQLAPPGREPSGFAFADPHYVREVFDASGWGDSKGRQIRFRYVAGEGEGAVEEAMDFLGEIGPASRAVFSLPEGARGAALQRMRNVIEEHFDGSRVEFPAAAWIWSAKALEPRSDYAYAEASA